MSNALVDAASKGNLGAIRAALAAGADMEARDDGGRTPLLALCWIGSGRAKMSKSAVAGALLLIERGADVSAADTDGATALHWAAASHGREVIDALIARRAAVVKDASGKTPLHYCIDRRRQDRDTSIWDRLLAAGCGLEDVDADGQTPLIYAATYGNSDAVEYLLAKGSSRDARDATGKTAIDRARELGHEPTRKKIIKLLAPK